MHFITMFTTSEFYYNTPEYELYFQEYDKSHTYMISHREAKHNSNHKFPIWLHIIKV